MNTVEPIAIVGYHCQLPGAADAQVYWHNLLHGQQSITPVSKQRWDLSDAPNLPDNLLHHPAIAWGGFLDNVDLFDAAFFNIAEDEARLLDPQQRLVLQSTWQCLEHAGIVPSTLRGLDVGVFVAACAWDYNKLVNRDVNVLCSFIPTGTILSVLANRISYCFDFRGPSMVIDSACSSSLVAMHLASQSLRSGESEYAVVAGVNLILSPETNISFAHAGALSSNGQSSPFSDQANGYIRSEGVASVLLMPLQQAQEKGHHIHGLIRASSCGQRGAGNGLTAPNSASQIKLMQKALQMANLKAENIQYIEAHATGTVLGDSIEFNALKSVYGQSDIPCFLGSGKANIGHTEAVAGLAALIKIILMFEHKMIPPQIHCTSVNAMMAAGFGRSRFTINQQPGPWHGKGSKLAAINSIGMGGTNAHVLLESFNQVVDRTTVNPTIHVLKVTAKSAYSLVQQCRAYAQFLAEPGQYSLADFAISANVHRENMAYRKVFYTDSLSDLQQQLMQFSSVTDVAQPVSRNPSCAFWMNGQAPIHDDVRHYLKQFCVFAECYAKGEALLAQDGYSPTVIAQFKLLMTRVALAELWASLGVSPEAIVCDQDSLLAALCITQRITLQNSVLVISGAKTLESCIQLTASDGIPIYGIEDGMRDLSIPSWVNHRNEMMGSYHWLVLGELGGSDHDSKPRLTPSMIRVIDTQATQLSIASLYEAGFDINWQAFYRRTAPMHCRYVVLPSYAFEYKRYWIEYSPRPLLLITANGTQITRQRDPS